MTDDLNTIRHTASHVLAAAVKKFGGDTVVGDVAGRTSSPWELQRAVRVARKKASGTTTCGTTSGR